MADANGFLAEKLPQDVVNNRVIQRDLELHINQFLKDCPPRADDTDIARTHRRIAVYQIALLMIFQATRKRADYERLIEAHFDLLPVEPVIQDNMKGNHIYEGFLCQSIKSARSRAIQDAGDRFGNHLRELEPLIER